MVRAPPPCGPRPGPRSHVLAQTRTRVPGRAGPGSPALFAGPSGDRAEAAGAVVGTRAPPRT